MEMETMPEVTKPGFYIYYALNSREPDRYRVAFIYPKDDWNKKNWKILNGPYKRRFHAVDKSLILP